MLMRFLIAAALPLHLATASAQPPTPSAGQLLYETHCIACHSAQLHWRDKRQASDWPGLKGWVGRWQRELGLRWSDAEVAEVARYLNERYYHHPQTSDRVSAATPR